MSKFFKQKNTGFTLVETLVAISIFTVSLLGMMSVLGSSIANTNYAKQKITAEYLAQEGIEHARNIRDTHVISTVVGQDGWDNFKLDLSSVTNYPTSGDYINFTRTITATPVPGSPNEVKITSDVKWTQGSGEKHIIFSENLFNWVE